MTVLASIPKGRRLLAVTRRLCCALLFFLLLAAGSGIEAQVVERRTPIGVIKAIRTPLSPGGSSPGTASSSSPPQVVDVEGLPVRFDAGQANMAHRVVVESSGGGPAGEAKALRVRQIAESLTEANASFSYRFSRAFDGSAFDAVRGPADLDQAFPSGAPASTPYFRSSVNSASKEQQAAIVAQFDGHVPGGVVIEGVFDPGGLHSVVYDARYHALVLDRGAGARVAYLPISAADVVALCQAIAGDERGRVAISMEHPPLAFAALRRRCSAALNMFIADQFLGALVFGDLSESADMATDFQSPGDYEPRRPANGFGAAAVMFTFRSGEYVDDGSRLEPSQSALDILFIPLQNANGAFVAAMTTDVPGEFLQNAQHIVDNLDYYRGEPIVDLMFRYAQVSTLLRGLKVEGVDLYELARAIDFANGGRN